MFRLITLIFTFLIFCSTYANEFNLGNFPANQTQTHTFKITNSGNQTMRLGKIRSSCTCDKNTISATELAPGAQATLNVELPANSLSGKFSKTIYVETNLAKPRFLKFTLSGNAVDLLQIKSTSTIDLKTLPVNQEITLQYQIVATQTPVELQVENPNPEIIKSLKIIDDANNSAKKILIAVINSTIERPDFTFDIPIKINSPANWPPYLLKIQGNFKNARSKTPEK